MLHTHPNPNHNANPSLEPQRHMDMHIGGPMAVLSSLVIRGICINRNINIKFANRVNSISLQCSVMVPIWWGIVNHENQYMYQLSIECLTLRKQGRAN